MGVRDLEPYFGGWIESDVYWGLSDLDFDPWPYRNQHFLTLSHLSLALSWWVSQNVVTTPTAASTVSQNSKCLITFEASSWEN